MTSPLRVAFLLFFLVLSRPCTAASELLSPIWDRLDPGEISASLSRLAHAPASPSRSIDQLIHLFYLAEYQHLTRNIHEARRLRNEILKSCSSWRREEFRSLDPSLRSRAAALCVLTRCSREEATGLSALFSDNPAVSFNLVFREGGLSEDEKFYVEGRVFSECATTEGRDFKRALVALTLLERKRPDLPSVAFYLGRTYLIQGNEERGREILEKSARRPPGDRRARLFLNGERWVRNPEHVDELQAGVAFGVGYSGGEGAVLSVGLRDDRIWDTPRSASASALVTTRSRYALEGRFSDDVFLTPVRAGLAAFFSQGLEDFFGIGPGTSVASRSVIRSRSAGAEVSAARSFLDHWAFEGFWRGEYGQVLEEKEGTSFSTGATSLLRPAKSWSSGPGARLSWSALDSVEFPHRGNRFSVEGYFPERWLGSDLTFERWRFQAIQLVPLGLQHHLRGDLRVVHTNGEVPFAAFPGVAADSSVAGIRRGRLRDRNSVSVGTTYYRRLALGLGAEVFGMGASVSAEFRNILKSSWQWGGGGALLFHRGRGREWEARVGLARFAGETLFDVSGGLSF